MANKIINKTIVKEFLKTKDVRIGGDVIDALGEEVLKLLSSASVRAKKNERKTLYSYDL